MIVDGRHIADGITTELAHERQKLPHVMRLGVLMAGGDAATDSYVKIKEKVADKLQVVLVREVLEEGATTAQALRAIERMAGVCEGIVVQLPLPPQINTEEVLAALPPAKDTDALGLHPVVQAPVALAVKEILARSGVITLDLFGIKTRKVVVVGEGRLVGKPAAAMLRELGAEVKIVSLEQGSLSDLKDADIVVSGAGSPGLIKPEMLKAGVILIDAGTSESQGKVVGDCDPACAEVASIFTPVPSGVGPIAVAMLFKNLFELKKRTPGN